MCIALKWMNCEQNNFCILTKNGIFQAQYSGANCDLTQRTMRAWSTIDISYLIWPDSWCFFFQLFLPLISFTFLFPLYTFLSSPYFFSYSFFFFSFCLFLRCRGWGQPFPPTESTYAGNFYYEKCVRGPIFPITMALKDAPFWHIMCHFVLQSVMFYDMPWLSEPK